MPGLDDRPERAEETRRSIAVRAQLEEADTSYRPLLATISDRTDGISEILRESNA